MTSNISDLVAGKSLTEWREFARRDDCLDQMVPSDLRQILSALTPSEPVVEVKEGYNVQAFDVTGEMEPEQLPHVPLSEALTIRTADEVRKEALEEAAKLVENRHDDSLKRGYNGRSDCLRIAKDLRALIDTPTQSPDKAELIPEPVAYQYEHTDPITGKKFWGKSVFYNGVSTSVSRPLYAFPPDKTMSVACPEPTKGDETYYTRGKTAEWFQSLSHKDFAEAVFSATQDLNDSGLGDDLDKWMPFQVVLDNAAYRINRLIDNAPTVAEAAKVLLNNLPDENPAWADAQDKIDNNEDVGDVVAAFLRALAAQKGDE